LGSRFPLRTHWIVGFSAFLLSALPLPWLGPASPALAQSQDGGHHHHEAAPSPRATPGQAAPKGVPAPAPAGSPGLAGTIDTPSWFAGGEGLFVPPYYDTFKGLDLAGLGPVQRERFLHWVNTEFCTCGQSGCRRDTIANCYVNDPTCPWAPVRIRKILEEVKKGATLPWAPYAVPAPGR
jgi:hypothetical protein